MRPAAALAVLVLAALPAAAIARPADLARVEVAFTPGDDIAGLIARRIARAQATVRVQAYLFTDARIARSLLGALRRGIAVEVIGDAGQHAEGGLPWLPQLERAGARIYLDSSAAASHNKIVIVDGEGSGATVVTGSYNFTRSARSRNAENVVVISGNRAVTDRFMDNFRARRAQSFPWHS